jgi:hypothetical protein
VGLWKLKFQELSGWVRKTSEAYRTVDMRIEKELSKVKSYSALKRVGDRPVYIDGAFSSHMISLLCHSRTGSEEMHTNFRDIVRIHGYTQFSTQKKKNMEDGSLAISSRYRGKLENER